MALLHLIDNSQIHLNKHLKVIPAELFSQLLDIEAIIEKVKKDTITYKEQIARECETLKEQARKDGYETGLQQWTQELLNLEKQFQLKIKEIEQAIIPVALGISKRVLGRELELNPKALADIIATNLKTVSQNRKISIYVSQADIKIIEESRDKLKAVFESLESLLIKERADIEPGGFIIETESGIINLSTVEKQWRPIEAMFEAFSEDNNEAESAEAVKETAEETETKE